MTANKFISDLEKKLKATVSKKRYLHSLGVKETAIYLAKKYKVDETAVTIAALYHDIAKELSDEELIRYYKEYDNNDSGKEIKIKDLNLCLVHGKIAVGIAKNEIPKNFKFRQEILDAIGYHTTSRKGMHDIEKIIYLADLTEKNREFENVDNIRYKQNISLDLGMREALIEIVRYLNKSKQRIDENAFFALEDYFLKNENADKFFLNDYTLEELKVFFQFKFRVKPYRALQVFEGIYKGVKEIEDIKNLPANLKEELNKHTKLHSLKVKKKEVSKIDGTIKYLFETYDKEYVETVLMKYKFGNSVCISTQIGCKVGCKFCYSKKNGFVRNLSPAEIIDQFLILRNENGIEETKHIVFMGIGEPLNNFDNLKVVIGNLTNVKGLGLGRKFLTVSTSGIVDKLNRILDEGLNINVAISLHHYDDEKRTKIMPINKKYPIKDLLKFAKLWNKKLNRRITLEYALIDGFNDSIADAKKLSKLVSGLNAHVNLIRLNDCENYRGSDDKTANAFKDELNKNNIIVTLRRSLGSDISAACGMLRIKNS